MFVQKQNMQGILNINTKDFKFKFAGVVTCFFLILTAYLWLVPSAAQAQSHWKAPAKADTITNPYKVNKSLLALGKKVYMSNCSSCHGSDAKGDGPAAVALNPRPANLKSKKVQKESIGALYWKIDTGKGGMPSWKKKLSKKQAWAVVSYIKNLDPPKGK
ncbi:MAG TPA: cytochrome c [Balneolaceae bacterium]|nr:cytochrome c [Balneolaceae bacterium]